MGFAGLFGSGFEFSGIHLNSMHSSSRMVSFGFGLYLSGDCWNIGVVFGTVAFRGTCLMVKPGGQLAFGHVVIIATNKNKKCYSSNLQRKSDILLIFSLIFVTTFGGSFLHCRSSSGQSWIPSHQEFSGIHVLLVSHIT